MRRMGMRTACRAEIDVPWRAMGTADPQEQSMIFHENKPSGTALPIIVILVAMIAIVATLALSSGHQAPARVWVPTQSAGP